MPPNQAPQDKRKRIKVRHFKWSPQEDLLLRKLVEGKKTPNWTYIAKRFTNRNTRQCKDRWNYYLCPTVNNEEWTPEEDKILIEKFQEFGTQWTKIAVFFDNRTNTNVKNRYLAIMRNEARNQNKGTIFSSKTESIDSDAKQDNTHPINSEPSSETLSSPEILGDDQFQDLFRNISLDLMSNIVTLQDSNSVLDDFNLFW